MMAPRLEKVFAPAKVNLYLHVTGRRADGYHLLESLAAFADVGDYLSFSPSSSLSLQVTGPFKDGIGAPGDNLVLRAAILAANKRHSPLIGRFDLEKNLPAGAGLGGGSSDAAAGLRLLQTAGLVSYEDTLDIAPRLGADVSVCLNPAPQMMRGIGEHLTPAPYFPPLPAVLVWPNVFCDTATVFKKLEIIPGTTAPPLPKQIQSAADLIGYLSLCRNDLEKPAISLFPVIETALNTLRAQGGILLARMSGSGSACFGLFDSLKSARNAAEHIQKKYPAWWVHAGYINP